MLSPRRTLGALLVVLLPLVALGQEKSVRPDINKAFKDPDLPKYLQTFEGESREIYAQRKQIVEACQLKPGMVVADVGAGTGLFSRLFAAQVGPTGRVFAVDIAPKFLDHIDKTSKEAGLKNIHTVLCTQTSAELPANSVDLVFICDTYHHFEFPFRTLASLHRALKPGGKLVVIDFHRIPGKSSDWVLGHVRAGQDVFTKEIVSSGFKPIDEQKFLKENYFLRFEKVEKEKPDLTKPQSFTYKTAKEAELAMHVHFPKEWQPGEKRPAIVFFFGGGWTNGRVEQFEPQAAYLASRGMVAARADYRVKSRHNVTPAACVEDAKSAVRWLRRNAVLLGIDPERIVAAGGSAGGHIAACTALTDGLDAPNEDRTVSSRPNALVLFNPVLNFEGVPNLAERVGNDEKLVRLLSPTRHLTKATPPTLILFGTEDRLLRQGEAFLARAKEQDQRTELFTAEGEGHGFFNRSPWRERTLKRADEFLASLGYLTGPATVKEP